MNKAIIITGGTVSLIAVAVLMFKPGTAPENDTYAAVAKSFQKKENPDHIDISFETHPKKLQTAQNNNHVSSVINLKKSPSKKEPDVVYKTYDAHKQFELALICPGLGDAPALGSFRVVTGTIDGSSFKLKVPDYIFKTNQEGTLTLRVKNIRNQQEQNVPLYFLDEVKDANNRHAVALSSSDLSNYKHTVKKGWLPPLD
jgi:hypothetical protein